MIKILVYAPNPLDTTSLYRSWGPYGHLAREHSNKFQITHVTQEEVNWCNLQQHHIFFAQRPWAQETIKNMEKAKDFGLTVIIDYDDDLFAVPSENKLFTQFQQNHVLAGIIGACKIADQVHVSTKALKDSFVEVTKESNDKFIVIPNAIDTRWWKFEQPIDKLPRIVWRGGESHLKDIISVQRPLIELLNEYTGWTLSGFGAYAFPWLDHLDRKKYTWRGVELIHFHRALYESKGTVGIVPLLNSRFNRAKSNIAAMELAMANMAVVARRLPEFEIPGVYNYETEDEFKEKVKEAMMSGKPNASKTKQYVLENLTLDRINEDRIKILCGF